MLCEQEKNQSVETDSEITEIMEFVDTLYKNELKVDRRLKCVTYNYKTFRSKL